MNLSLVYLGLTCRYYTLSIYKCQAFIPNKLSSFSWKEKLPKTFSYGVVADDTLPRNARAYELPSITIYKV